MQNSNAWIERIIPKLFEAEDRYLGVMVTELNKANSEIKRQSFQGFMHMGKKFIPPEFLWNKAMIARRPVPPLHFSLMDQSAEFIRHQTRVDLDKSQIRQILFQQLHQCNDLQEIRDSLPDCLVSLIPELQQVNRYVQDPLWLVRSNPHAVAQYNKILPKIEFYTMSRMIY